MTTTYCLSPVIRFNMADWIYLQLIPIGVCCTVIRLRYCTVYLLGLRINIRKYIYIEKRCCCVIVWIFDFGEKWLGHENPTFLKTVWFHILEWNDLVMTLVLFIHFFSFHLEVTCSLHVFHLWYRGNELIQEKIYHIIWY